MASDEKKARFLYDYVMGRPTHASDNTALGDWLNVVQGLNYSRLMGQVGFAQIPEIAGTIQLNMIIAAALIEGATFAAIIFIYLISG